MFVIYLNLYGLELLFVECTFIITVYAKMEHIFNIYSHHHCIAANSVVATKPVHQLQIRLTVK